MRLALIAFDGENDNGEAVRADDICEGGGISEADVRGSEDVGAGAVCGGVGDV